MYSYFTIRQEMEMYAKRIRKYEKQRKYERNIVCLPPEREITPDSIYVSATTRWKPG